MKSDFGLFETHQTRRGPERRGKVYTDSHSITLDVCVSECVETSVSG